MPPAHSESQSRRRFLFIAGAATGLALLPGIGEVIAAPNADLRFWRGVALGADAMLQIHHRDRAAADRLIERCLMEVARLERIFSLYREDSALRQLNRDGKLDHPPQDLLLLLAQAEQFGRVSGGAFDITVQPLWDLYAAHFTNAEADPAGPAQAAIDAALRRVDYRAVDVSSRQIRFARPGMAITLNGIAQGYITDRIVDLLRNAGIDRSLVDMGEIRAIGGRPSGGPWIVGLEDPLAPGQSAEQIEIENLAVATSGGYGTEFDSAGRFSHIFDPASGSAGRHLLSVSVIAPLAATADALSTAFAVLPPAGIPALVRRFAVAAHLTFPDGSRLTHTA